MTADPNQTHSRECKIVNTFGIHARPAAMFVTVASRFKSEVLVEKDGVRVNGKSIMGLLTLEAYHDSTILILTRGPDSEAALETLAKVVANKFSEE